MNGYLLIMKSCKQWEILITLDNMSIVAVSSIYTKISLQKDDVYEAISYISSFFIPILAHSHRSILNSDLSRMKFYTMYIKPA